MHVCTIYRRGSSFPKEKCPLKNIHTDHRERVGDEPQNLQLFDIVCTMYMSKN